MSWKRKSVILFIIAIACLIIFFFLYLFINSFFTKTKTYYIPEVNMYIKTIWKPHDKYGYILLGNNPDMTISDSTDYIKVYPKVSNGIFLKYNNDTVWVNNPIELNVRNKNNSLQYEYIETNKPQKINAKKYIIIDKVNESEPLLFEKKETVELLFINKPYIEISVTEYFDSLLRRNTGDSVYTNIEPLK